MGVCDEMPRRRVDVDVDVDVVGGLYDCNVMCILFVLFPKLAEWHMCTFLVGPYLPVSKGGMGVDWGFVCVAFWASCEQRGKLSISAWPAGWSLPGCTTGWMRVERRKYTQNRRAYTEVLCLRRAGSRCWLVGGGWFVSIYISKVP